VSRPHTYTRYAHPLPRAHRRSLRRHRGGPPLLFLAAAAFFALSVIAHHPFLALLGLCWVGSRLARRAHRSWDREEPRRSDRMPGRATATDRARPVTRVAELPPTAQAAWASARRAVVASTALSEPDRVAMLATLDAGRTAVLDLTSALEELDGTDDARLDAVAGAAAARAARFEGDCATLRRSLAALEIQEGDASPLDALGAAAEALAGRVDARSELDRLG
jgi:hypothetical protein